MVTTVVLPLVVQLAPAGPAGVLVQHCVEEALLVDITPATAQLKLCLVTPSFVQQYHLLYHRVEILPLPPPARLQHGELGVDATQVVGLVNKRDLTIVGIEIPNHVL